MTGASPLRGVLALGILSLLGLALAAPWARSQFPLLLAGLSAAFGQICHQEPSRALLVEGLPSLLCARCLGTFAGGSIAFLLAGTAVEERGALVACPGRRGVAGGGGLGALAR